MLKKITHLQDNILVSLNWELYRGKKESFFLLAEHKIRRMRTICTSIGVPRTRIRRTKWGGGGGGGGVKPPEDA